MFLTPFKQRIFSMSSLLIVAENPFKRFLYEYSKVALEFMVLIICS